MTSWQLCQDPNGPSFSWDHPRGRGIMGRRADWVLCGWCEHQEQKSISSQDLASCRRPAIFRASTRRRETACRAAWGPEVRPSGPPQERRSFLSRRSPRRAGDVAGTSAERGPEGAVDGRKQGGPFSCRRNLLIMYLVLTNTKY